MAQKYSKPNYFNTLLTDFIALLYPEICVGCSRALKQSDHIICFDCSMNMPRTYYEKHPNTPIEKLFWYKADIQEATAAYFFTKKSRIQNMIHAFKYRGNQEAAIFLGEKLGILIRNSHRFKTIDCILPVPLHPHKKKIRGYNQAELLAQGISYILDIPLEIDLLLRKDHNSSQTNKGLYTRWANVNSVFCIENPERITNKHVLLVDDVITSGATIEACAQQILAITNTKVSIASLAIASG